MPEYTTQFISNAFTEAVVLAADGGTTELVAKDLSLNAAVERWRRMFGVEDTDSSTPSRPYGQVDLIFACVNKLISSIQGLAPVLSNAADEIVEAGPAYEFLFANPKSNWENFITATIGHYALSRDVFWVFPDKMPGGLPDDIFVISGTQMDPLLTPQKTLRGWKFRGVNNVTTELSLDEVYQWKNFNPYDRFHGLGPATAARLNINYLYAATLFNSSALANGCEPGLIVTMPGRPSEEEIEMFRANLEDRHRGAGKAKRTALFTGGADVKTIAQNMVDMQVAELTGMSGERICTAFEVPPAVVGLVTDAQYSHGPAQRDFIFNTILPLGELFAGHITTGLLKYLVGKQTGLSLKSARLYAGNASIPLRRNKFFAAARRKAAARREIFFWFDGNQHHIVQEAQREISEKVLKYTDSGVPLNQIIDAYDLPFDAAKITWGDDWWIGMGQVPARFTLEAGVEGLTGPAAAEGEGEEPEEPPEEEEPKQLKIQNEKLKIEETETKESEAQRLRLWQAWVISWAGIERENQTALIKYFLRQQRILNAALKAAYAAIKNEKLKMKNQSVESAQSVVAKDSADEMIARVVFDLKVEDGKLRVINQTFFSKASELGIRQSLTELLALSADELAAQVAALKDLPLLRARRAVSVARLADVNKNRLAQINRALRAGLDNGETLQELTDRISPSLKENRARALRIARTQTSGAVSTGRHAGMEAAGVELKAWITSKDNEVRQSHRDAGVKYAQGIPLNEYYILAGGSLLEPGDPACGNPAEIVNCRCLSVARRAKGKTINLDSYGSFYSYAEMKPLAAAKPMA